MGQIEKNAAKLLRNEIGKGRDAHRVWEEFLDFCLDCFDARHFVDGTWEEAVRDNFNAYPNYAKTMMAVLDGITLSIEMGELIDPLGTLYEELFQSKGKASQLGQFFTPTHLCSLMAEIVTDDGDDGERVYDCACGSGRTLIAHRVNDVKRGKYYSAWYVGEDIDLVSVKMCALNLMWYGCRGEVYHADTLRMEYFGTMYKINEVRYPFLCEAYSVRKQIVNQPTMLDLQPKTQPKQENKQLELTF